MRNKDLLCTSSLQKQISFCETSIFTQGIIALVLALVHAYIILDWIALLVAKNTHQELGYVLIAFYATAMVFSFFYNGSDFIMVDPEWKTDETELQTQKNRAHALKRFNIVSFVILLTSLAALFIAGFKII